MWRGGRGGGGFAITITVFLADGLNGIKYAAYRTAMKLRAIQKITHCKPEMDTNQGIGISSHLQLRNRSEARLGLQGWSSDNSRL